MKNYITLLILMMSIVSFGQNDSKREQIKSLKTAFITSELSLTSEESSKFWPIYNAYDDQQFELRHKKMRPLGKKLANADQLSEKEAQNLLNEMQQIDDDLYQNRKKLVANLKNVISPLKILKLKKAEDDFNRKLLRQYKKKD